MLFEQVTFSCGSFKFAFCYQTFIRFQIYYIGAYLKIGIFILVQIVLRMRKWVIRKTTYNVWRLNLEPRVSKWILIRTPICFVNTVCKFIQWKLSCYLIYLILTKTKQKWHPHWTHPNHQYRRLLHWLFKAHYKIDRLKCYSSDDMGNWVLTLIFNAHLKLWNTSNDFCHCIGHCLFLSAMKTMGENRNEFVKFSLFWTTCVLFIVCEKIVQ